LKNRSLIKTPSLALHTAHARANCPFNNNVQRSAGFALPRASANEKKKMKKNKRPLFPEEARCAA